MLGNTEKSKIALILGSGFSKNANLPTTTELTEQFLQTPDFTFSNKWLEKEINRILREFWEDAFGYEYREGSTGDYMPTMENHFTTLDLAANSGHHLGSKYNPKKLRAIRRMSIHRIFTILNKLVEVPKGVSVFLNSLINDTDLSIITLNWDIVPEKRFDDAGETFNYGIDVFNSENISVGHGPTSLLKLHGSANWVYCDNCRRVFADFAEKNSLLLEAFLEKDDFMLFGYEPNDLHLRSSVNRSCPNCGSLLAGRVATFSYRKDFSIAQFQTIWSHAFEKLRRANHWLFIGYSLPEADYEFKHLLKSAQLGRERPQDWRAMFVYTGSANTESRYLNFFGMDNIIPYKESLHKLLDSKIYKDFISG